MLCVNAALVKSTKAIRRSIIGSVYWAIISSITAVLVFHYQADNLLVQYIPN